LGPVHAVMQARPHLKTGQPLIVNYCDFTCDWDYADFKKFVGEQDPDGCIPCYRGFHPHTLWSNYYAYVRTDGLRGLDIQEKTPFTDRPRDEFASSGTYYFKSLEVFEENAAKMIARDLTVGGEFYASMVYKPMLDEQKNVQVYELDHFMQWGVPDDLQEYLYWSGAFRALMSDRQGVRQSGAVMIPMAGLGSRFSEAGYDTPKPLIDVSGHAMAEQALADLPRAERQVFIVRDDMAGLQALTDGLTAAAAEARFVVLDHMTDGQASTCMEAMAEVEAEACLTIAACDNGMLYDADRLGELMQDADVDVIVWTASGYPGAIRNPHMYGWVDCDAASGKIKNVSVKTPLDDPRTDPIVVGAFTFKKAADFSRSVDRMRQRDGRINGEFYVDSAINDAIALGLNCVIFPIDYYLCWGTPNDLRTFEYWQDCLHAWDQHPYRRDADVKGTRTP
ncbi:MAG: NTP transferase domain-containing protein, partial [Alphaproteobacteria bacterium]